MKSTKIFKLVVTIIIYVIAAFMAVSAVGTIVAKQPFLMTAIRSNSMYPQLERGDLVILNEFSSKDSLSTKDIIVFRVEEGNYIINDWMMHRITDGNARDGFITKGDANERTDQEDMGIPPIKPEWIAGKALVLRGKPLKIPLLGHLALYAEQSKNSQLLLPIIAVILAVIIAVGELKNTKKGKHAKTEKTESLDMQLIYFFSGLTIAVMVGASMLATSRHLNLSYGVSETEEAALMGSNVGVLKIGDEVDRPLAEFNNNGFFPLLVSITTDDEQISFSRDKLILKPGQYVETQMTVKALNPGDYNSSIRVGMFFPLLPLDWIHVLAQRSYWLALIVISLIPGLPLMLYPVLDKKMRKSTAKVIRQRIRRIKGELSRS
mgnify:FL=1